MAYNPSRRVVALLAVGPAAMAPGDGGFRAVVASLTPASSSDLALEGKSRQRDH